MKQKKILLLSIIIFGAIGGAYLMIQIKQALDEYNHWKSREAVLEKELQDLRQEVTKHRKFLEQSEIKSCGKNSEIFLIFSCLSTRFEFFRVF